MDQKASDRPDKPEDELSVSIMFGSALMCSVYPIFVQLVNQKSHFRDAAKANIAFDFH